MKESIKKIGKQMMVLVSKKPYQSPSLVSYQATWLFGPLWITITSLSQTQILHNIRLSVQLSFQYLSTLYV